MVGVQYARCSASTISAGWSGCKRNTERSYGVDKYLARRWHRAQEYAANQIVCVGHGQYLVVSSRGGYYSVRVTLKDRKLVFARCNCPDWGTTHLRNVPVCKHVLAAAQREVSMVEKRWKHTDEAYTCPICGGHRFTEPQCILTRIPQGLDPKLVPYIVQCKACQGTFSTNVVQDNTLYRTQG